MKNILKVAAAVLVAALTYTQAVYAANQVTVSVTGAATNSAVAAHGVLVNTLNLANSGTNVVTLTLFDAPGTAVFFTNAAYTYYTSYNTNIVTVITNISGVLQTNTNTFKYTYSATTAGATNGYTKLGTYTIPANTTLTINPNSVANFGLLVTNTDPGANGAWTITYTPLY